MTAPTGGTTEPSADIRQMASAWRQMYVALTAEGFNPTQALHLVGTVITASLAANGGNTGSTE